jgi:hypothetical protein
MESGISLLVVVNLGAAEIGRRECDVISKASSNRRYLLVGEHLPFIIRLLHTPTKGSTREY